MLFTTLSHNKISVFSKKGIPSPSIILQNQKIFTLAKQKITIVKS